MNTKRSYNQIQAEEAATWLIEDPVEREEKAMRELIRYKWLLKQMNLWGKGSLDTRDMWVADVGCGPLGGVSTLLEANFVTRIDPLIPEYEKYFQIENGDNRKAEEVDYSPFDLIVSTNCVDHFENPHKFFLELNGTAKYSAYFAHFHAINNAITHPHEAHVHNINPEMLRDLLGEQWELVWQLDYETDKLTYGWRKQPAFSQLWRKITK